HRRPGARPIHARTDPDGRGVCGLQSSGARRRGGRCCRAAFLPSFVMMLAVLPVLDHVRKLVWTKAAMRGIGPAVIGMLGVSLVRMAPHALPDVFAAATLIATVIALMVWRLGTIKAMVVGSLLGVLRNRLSSLRAVRVVLCIEGAGAVTHRARWNRL